MRSRAEPKVDSVPSRTEVTKGVHMAIPGVSRVGKTQPAHSFPSLPGGLPGPPSLVGSRRPHPALTQAEGRRLVLLAHTQHPNAEERRAHPLCGHCFCLRRYHRFLQRSEIQVTHV